MLEIDCLQILRDKTVKIVFSEPEASQRFFDEGFSLNGVNVELKPPYKPDTRVIVQDLPFHMPASVVRTAFSSFGEVKSIFFRKETDSLKSGDRIVSLVLKQAIPRHIVVGGYPGRVFYSGQPPFCEICRGDHLTSRCPLKGKCRFCRESGHFARVCPQKDSCSYCEERGHVRLDCPYRDASSEELIDVVSVEQSSLCDAEPVSVSGSDVHLPAGDIGPSAEPSVAPAPLLSVVAEDVSPIPATVSSDLSSSAIPMDVVPPPISFGGDKDTSLSVPDVEAVVESPSNIVGDDTMMNSEDVAPATGSVESYKSNNKETKEIVEDVVPATSSGNVSKKVKNKNPTNVNKRDTKKSKISFRSDKRRLPQMVANRPYKLPAAWKHQPPPSFDAMRRAIGIDSSESSKSENEMC